MLDRYRQWMYDWETRLTTRDTNRVVRPLDWGVEWTRGWPCVNGNFPADHSAAGRFLLELNRRIVDCSDEFFAYRSPDDFGLQRNALARPLRGSSREAVFLKFQSPVSSPYPENNIAMARWFPARGRRAVVVLPQWNSDSESHTGLCRIFQFQGIAALRLSLSYHDARKPPEIERADYAVSANVARTIDAARQAVMDVRCCL
ncbi:MAG: alpha/beta hydrolase family protein, partial [Terriglobales bacterium]